MSSTIKLPPAKAGVVHKMRLYRTAPDGQVTQWEFELDSRMMILSETCLNPGTPSPVQQQPGLSTEQEPADEASRLQVAHLKALGYTFEMKNGRVCLITGVPYAEQQRGLIFVLQSPCPSTVPAHICESLRQEYQAAVAALEEANPECEDCDRGKVLQRYMAVARKSLPDEIFQAPSTGN